LPKHTVGINQQALQCIHCSQNKKDIKITWTLCLCRIHDWRA